MGLKIFIILFMAAIWFSHVVFTAECDDNRATMYGVPSTWTPPPTQRQKTKDIYSPPDSCGNNKLLRNLKTCKPRHAIVG